MLLGLTRVLEEEIGITERVKRMETKKRRRCEEKYLCILLLAALQGRRVESTTEVFPSLQSPFIVGSDERVQQAVI
jgi:hypothetical protein